MSWNPSAAHLFLHNAVITGPDAALLVLTLGVLLIYVEINRPGMTLPGALGLLFSLLAIASLLRLNLSIAAVILAVSGGALLLLDLIRPTPVVVAAAAILALCLGLDRLVAGPVQMRPHAVTAVVCGLLLGAASSMLTRIARRARAHKAVD